MTWSDDSERMLRCECDAVLKLCERKPLVSNTDIEMDEWLLEC